jgi:hypothetical protein
MSQNLDFEAIAQEIELHAVNEGRALADYLALHFTVGLIEIDIEHHRIANYIFDRTATDVLARFPRLIDADKPKLQNRAIAAIKTAFKTRLAH